LTLELGTRTFRTAVLAMVVRPSLWARSPPPRPLSTMLPWRRYEVIQRTGSRRCRCPCPLLCERQPLSPGLVAHPPGGRGVPPWKSVPCGVVVCFVPPSHGFGIRRVFCARLGLVLAVARGCFWPCALGAGFAWVPFARAKMVPSAQCWRGPRAEVREVRAGYILWGVVGSRCAAGPVETVLNPQDMVCVNPEN